MTSENNICRDHSGCLARLDNCEHENEEQWNKMIRMEGVMSATDKRINQIFTRINVILGGIAVSCLLLAVNAAIKLIGQ